jgi:nucleoside-diphosphate-sugar epimerase
MGPYEKSKILAERAALDYMQKLPEHERFELVTLNPSLLMGPPLLPGEHSSGNIMKMLMLGTIPSMPKVMFPIIDVRDAGHAHLLAAKVDGARN